MVFLFFLFFFVGFLWFLWFPPSPVVVDALGMVSKTGDAAIDASEFAGAGTDTPETAEDGNTAIIFLCFFCFFFVGLYPLVFFLIKFLSLITLYINFLMK